MTLEDRIAGLRQELQRKIQNLTLLIEYKDHEKWYEESLKGQRADYRYFVKELDGLLLDHQMATREPNL